jgi:FkbM family methyltransferase
MTWKLQFRAAALLKQASRALGVDIVREKNSPRRTLLGLRSRPIRSIIDVGANSGQFAKTMREFFPSAGIWSFEPLEEDYKALEGWAGQQNGLVRCFNVAIGDREGLINMNRHLQHSPSSSILATTGFLERTLPQTGPQQRVEVNITTLDVALDGMFEDFHPEILLKLDVQGYEEHVLRGARALLQRVDHVLLEVNLADLYEEQASFTRLVCTLADFGTGYRGNLAQAYGNDGSALWCDALFSRHPIAKHV